MHVSMADPAELREARGADSGGAGGVGAGLAASLVVARFETVHDLGTGRHKGGPLHGSRAKGTQ